MLGCIMSDGTVRLEYRPQHGERLMAEPLADGTRRHYIVCPQCGRVIVATMDMLEYVCTMCITKRKAKGPEQTLSQFVKGILLDTLA